MIVNTPSRYFLGAQPATDELIRGIVVAEETRAVRMGVHMAKLEMERARLELERVAIAVRRRKRRWRMFETVVIAIVGAVLFAMVVTGAGPFRAMSK